MQKQPVFVKMSMFRCCFVAFRHDFSENWQENGLVCWLYMRLGNGLSSDKPSSRENAKPLLSR